jgi:hypothetical protein
VSIMTSIETDRGPFGIQSLASLGVQLASIGSPPPLSCRDSLRSSVSTQHFADAVMETVGDPEWRVGRRSKSRPFFPSAKGKRAKTSKSIGSVASTNALEAGLNPIDADMPAKALLPPAYERSKMARVERG